MVGLFTRVSGLHIQSNHEVLLVYDDKRNPWYRYIPRTNKTWNNPAGIWQPPSDSPQFEVLYTQFQ